MLRVLGRMGTTKPTLLSMSDRVGLLKVAVSSSRGLLLLLPMLPLLAPVPLLLRFGTSGEQLSLRKCRLRPGAWCRSLSSSSARKTRLGLWRGAPSVRCCCDCCCCCRWWWWLPAGTSLLLLLLMPSCWSWTWLLSRCCSVRPWSPFLGDASAADVAPAAGDLSRSASVS